MKFFKIAAIAFGCAVLSACAGFGAPQETMYQRLASDDAKAAIDRSDTQPIKTDGMFINIVTGKSISEGKLTGEDHAQAVVITVDKRLMDEHKSQLVVASMDNVALFLIYADTDKEGAHYFNAYTPADYLDQSGGKGMKAFSVLKVVDLKNGKLQISNHLPGTGAEVWNAVFANEPAPQGDKEVERLSKKWNEKYESVKASLGQSGKETDSAPAT